MSTLKLNWQKYFYELVGSVLRHVGTVWASWGGLNIAHSAGFNIPKMNWEAFFLMTIMAGVIPAVAGFFQKTPLPEIEEVSVTTTTTVSKTKVKEDETIPEETRS